MIIWFALIIPVVFLAVVYFVWPRKIVWWELFIPIVVSLFLIAFMKGSIECVQTTDTEYWTGWIYKSEFQERWTEEWDEFIPEKGHFDDKGRYIVDVPAHWEHRVRHHPDEWWMNGSNGETYPISREYYKSLCHRWRNNTCDGIPSGHHNQTSRGDGRRWHTKWDRSRETMVTCTTTHAYENRVQASKSVFQFRKFKPKEANELGLFEYPDIDDVSNVPSILGDGGPTTSSANRMLQIRNAELGSAKQVRMWILIFHDPDQQIALDQESYWCGGNKNEFVLCVGVDKDYKVKWAYSFSWTEAEDLKIQVRQLAISQDTLDLNKIVEGMSDAVQEKFIRKHFSEFNYLTVEPPFGAVLATFVLTLLVNVGLSCYIVFNEFE